MSALQRRIDKATQVDPAAVLALMADAHREAWSEEPLPVKSGWLRDSFTVEGHTDHVTRFDGDGAVLVGSKAPYAGRIVARYNLGPSPYAMSIRQAEAAAAYIKEHGYGSA